ncbi:MAG: hypothetical protein ACP5MX_01335 [Candidatus Micrarchaeia archaeon]
MAKIIVIIVSAENDKINVALNFAKRQSEAGSDMRVLLFGPSEKAVAESPDLMSRFLELGSIKPKACTFVAKNAGIEEKLSKGLELLPAGQYITKSIDEGYQPISF